MNPLHHLHICILLCLSIAILISANPQDEESKTLKRKASGSIFADTSNLGSSSTAKRKFRKGRRPRRYDTTENIAVPMMRKAADAAPTGKAKQLQPPIPEFNTATRYKTLKSGHLSKISASSLTGSQLERINSEIEIDEVEKLHDKYNSWQKGIQNAGGAMAIPDLVREELGSSSNVYDNSHSQDSLPAARINRQAQNPYFPSPEHLPAQEFDHYRADHQQQSQLYSLPRPMLHQMPSYPPPQLLYNGQESFVEDLGPAEDWQHDERECPLCQFEPVYKFPQTQITSLPSRQESKLLRPPSFLPIEFNSNYDSPPCPLGCETCSGIYNPDQPLFPVDNEPEQQNQPQNFQHRTGEMYQGSSKQPVYSADWLSYLGITQNEQKLLHDERQQLYDSDVIYGQPSDPKFDQFHYDSPNLVDANIEDFQAMPSAYTSMYPTVENQYLPAKSMPYQAYHPKPRLAQPRPKRGKFAFEKVLNYDGESADGALA